MNNDDDSVPDEIHRRLTNHLRYIVAPLETNEARRAGLLRACNGSGFLRASWALHDGDTPYVEVEVLADTADVCKVHIRLTDLGLTVDGDGLRFTPVDSK